MKRIFSEIAKQPWLTYLKILVGKEKENSQRATLIRGSGGTFALKIGAVLIGFAVSISLTRILGSHGFGVYAYAMAWVNVLAIIATVGMHNILLREIAIYHTNSELELLRGIIKFSTRIVLLISTAILAIGYLGIWSLHNAITPELQQSFLVALLTIPFAALTKMRQATMVGLQCPIYGQSPDMILRPIIFITLVWLTYILTGKSLAPAEILTLQILGTVAAFIIASFWLFKLLKSSYSTRDTAYNTRVWFYSALPLFVVEVMQLINNKADIFMLGALDTMHSVGIYAIAVQLSWLVTFILISVNAALAPAVAQLYNNKEHQQLQNIITKSARIVFLFSLPVALLLILAGEYILEIFGEGFSEGGKALAILATGQLVNAAMGSVGVILVMSGNERIVAIYVGIAAATNIILNTIFIPLWGIVGAAIATASSMIIWNVLLMMTIKKRLNIDSTAFGLLATAKGKNR